MDAANEEDRRRALGDFLRSRRAGLSPDDVGLSSGGTRRRAPGLRREEVAQLANVSVTWYTWLEQGRDITVSAQVLEGVSAALRLDEEEKEHLFRLARRRTPGVSGPAAETVGPELQTVLDSLGASPAWIIDPHWDILAWNRAATLVFGDFGTLPAAKRNILRFTFTDEALRRHLEDWEAFAQGMLATFRGSGEGYIGEVQLTRLVGDLTEESSEFAEWWSRHEVRTSPLQRLAMNHPDIGRMEFGNVSFWVNNHPGLRMCIYAATPGSGTVAKIRDQLGSLTAG